MDERSAPALSMAELAEIVAWHDAAPAMDYVTCGTGSYFDFYPIIPVVALRAAAGRPVRGRAQARSSRHALVQAESHIRTPEAAEAVLAAGQADLVSIVRGQIADPHLVAKARADRADDVRPCISCNQLCWGRRSRDYWISCLVNPSAGREFEWGGAPFAPARRAPVRARGRWRSGRSRDGPGGGRARPSRDAPGRARRNSAGSSGSPACSRPAEQIRDLLAWYGRRLAALGVDVRLETTATAGGRRGRGCRRGRARDGRAAAADRVPARAADGRSAARRRAPDVVSIHDVLDGTVDSRGAACRPRRPRGLARARDGVHLAEAGHEVTLVTSAAVVGGGLFHSAADVPLRRRFTAAGGTCAPNGDARAGTTIGAAVRSTLTGAIDRARGRRPGHRRDAGRRDVPRRRADATLGVAFHAIGDCVAPRRASLAFYEGRELALRL